MHIIFKDCIDYRDPILRLKLYYQNFAPSQAYEIILS